jgi:hypothetical protein
MEGNAWAAATTEEVQSESQERRCKDRTPPQSGICTVAIEKFVEGYIGNCRRNRGSACEPNATILNAKSELL